MEQKQTANGAETSVLWDKFCFKISFKSIVKYGTYSEINKCIGYAFKNKLNSLC